MSQLIKDRELTEHQKLQAAYALNLCTVSVSQIVDYDDINILEQEYEAILNNLNLENIPDDDSLLSILKQLLDTITYFRIEEGDKKLVERNYKQKMKNAIWNAVPNLSMIIAGGNPVAIGISLVSTIGTGYMNYRKAKAANDLEHEEQMWRIQRSAIEQFNGLRRELFDTAWRLSKNYGFSDKYRLTERQISQYNAILMDNDIIRKYQRLEAIQDKFEAYPPFWYFFGNAANEISRTPELCENLEMVSFYKGNAIEYFSKYWNNNKYHLLREDHLASACALEYADLLIDFDSDKKIIEELVEKAVEFSGNSCDILQLAAIAYLKIDDYANAAKLLKYLTNERYNTSVNAQLYSSLLIRGFSETGEQTYRYDYNILAKRFGDGMYLLPWPTDENAETFIEIQKRVITTKFEAVISAFRDIFSAKLNMILPVPKEGHEYDDKFFSPLWMDKRIAEMQSVLSVKDKRRNYTDRLNAADIDIRFVDTFNEMFKALEKIPFVNLENAMNTMRYKIKKNAGLLTTQYQLFLIYDYIKLQQLTSVSFCEDAFCDILHQIKKHIDIIEDMKGISELESCILSFCEANGIIPPSTVCNKLTKVKRDDELFFSYKLLGADAVEHSREKKKYHSMLNVVKDVAESFEQYKKVELLVSGNDKLQDYLKHNKIKDEVIAVIDDKTLFNDTDLVLTTTGVICFVRNMRDIDTTYENVEFDQVNETLEIKDMHNPEKKRTFKAEKECLQTIAELCLTLGNYSLIEDVE